VTRVVVIDHGAGNLVSIAQGLSRAGAEVDVVDNPNDIGDAAGIVLPGVGTTGAAMGRLLAADLVEPLREWGRPLLGICVGLQLFFDHSEEDGTDALGLIPGRVKLLEGAPLLPHIGWNDVSFVDDPLFAGVAPGSTFYFVHSFAGVPDDEGVVIARTEYGKPFVAAARTGNRVGVQFHPERSGAAGLRMLANFVAECGEARRAA
jgi:glutamine amidotransferase